jgi:hypothetical protein
MPLGVGAVQPNASVASADTTHTASRWVPGRRVLVERASTLRFHLRIIIVSANCERSRSEGEAAPEPATPVVAGLLDRGEQ